MLCFILAVAGCGIGGPSTDPVPVTDSSTGDLGPRVSACAIEVLSIQGSIRATVTPASVFLELRRGDCTNPGTIAAVSPNGILTQNVRAGPYHINVVNTSDAPVRYSLTVQYTTPSI